MHIYIHIHIYDILTDGIYTKGTSAHTQQKLNQGGVERASEGQEAPMAPYTQRSSPPKAAASASLSYS